MKNDVGVALDDDETEINNEIFISLHHLYKYGKWWS